MTAIAALLSHPAAQRKPVVDISPPVEASVFFIPPTAETTHAPQIMVPAGLSSSKLVVLTIADQEMSSAMVNGEPLGGSGSEIDDEDEGGTGYWGYVHYFNLPADGPLTVNLEFVANTRPRVVLAVVSGAAPGAPLMFSFQDRLLEIEPELPFTTGINLVVGSAPVHWTPLHGQVVLGQNDNAATAASVKRPLNAVTQMMGWRHDVAPPITAHIGALIPPGLITPVDPSYQAISSWAMNEATGTSSPDAGGLSEGIWTAPERGVGTIVTGGVRSTGLNGSTSQMRCSHVPQWAISRYTLHGYAQIDTLPVVNTHYNVANKDALGQVGGLSVEARNSEGQLRLRLFTKDSQGSAVFLNGSAAGVVGLTVGRAFLWALVVDPTDTVPTKLMVRQAGEASGSVVGTSGNAMGLQNNVRDLIFGRYQNGQSPLNGVMQACALGVGAMTLAQFNALPAPVSVVRSQEPPPTLTAQNINLGNLAPSSVTSIGRPSSGAQIDIANYVSGLGSGALTFEEVTDPANRATFANNGTVNARIVITMPGTHGAPTSESATFRVTEADAAPPAPPSPPSPPSGIVAIPAQASWTLHGAKILPGTSGASDSNLAGAMSPCEIVRSGNTYFLYYIGSNGTRQTPPGDDGGPRHRSVHVATAPVTNPGGNWTKQGQIITYRPNPSHANEQEEGIFGISVALGGAGVFNGLWTGNAAVSSTAVSAQVFYSTSTDGVVWTNNNAATAVLRMGFAAGYPGSSGDEFSCVGYYRHAATNAWRTLYSGTSPFRSSSHGLAHHTNASNQSPGSSIANYIPNSQNPLGGDAYHHSLIYRGGGIATVDVLQNCWNSGFTTTRLVRRTINPANTNAPNFINSTFYQWTGGRYTAKVFLDIEAGLWIMAYRLGGNEGVTNPIHIATAPATSE